MQRLKLLSTLIALFVVGLTTVGLGRAAVAHAKVSDGTYRMIRPTEFIAMPTWSTAVRMDDSSDVANGIVLLMGYISTCSICSRNTENWLAMMSALTGEPTSVRVVLASVEPDSVQEAYWSHLDARNVSKATITNVDAFIRLVGTPSVPLTALIVDGRLWEAHVGLLGEERRSHLLKSIATAAER